MKCPYCNEEMELGYLQCGYSMLWSTKKHKATFRIDKKLDDIAMPIDLWGTYLETYLCKKCNVMISPLKT